MTIPTERLHNIVLAYTGEFPALATELLAAREQLASNAIVLDAITATLAEAGYNLPLQEQVGACIADVKALTKERDHLLYRVEKAETDVQCVTLTGNAIASDSSLYCGNSVRYWYDKAQAYKDAFRIRDEAMQRVCALTQERDSLFNRVGALLHRVTDWRDAFAMPDEPDAEAIERTRAALAATEGEQGGKRS